MKFTSVTYKEEHMEQLKQDAVAVFFNDTELAAFAAELQQYTTQDISTSAHKVVASLLLSCARHLDAFRKQQPIADGANCWSIIEGITNHLSDLQNPRSDNTVVINVERDSGEHHSLTEIIDGLENALRRCAYPKPEVETPVTTAALSAAAVVLQTPLAAQTRFTMLNETRKRDMNGSRLSNSTPAEIAAATSSPKRIALPAI